MALPQKQQWADNRSSVIDDFESAFPQMERACIKMIREYDQRGLINDSLLSTFLKINTWHQAYHKKWFYNSMKRLADLLFALLAIGMLSPLLGWVALAIKLDSHGSVFYRQMRVGQHCKPFSILKFRTMVEGADRKFSFYEPNLKLIEYTPDERITRIGRFLRTWSIDELPQLWNILLGQMSFIGPRPLSIDDTSTIPEQYTIRFTVKPGLGGLWQATTPDEKNGLRKVAKDCEYVKIRSALLDIKLTLGTLFVALKGRRVR